MPSLWYGFIGCEKLTCVIWVCCVNMHVIVVTEPVSKLFGILWNCGRNNWGVYQRLIRCYCSVDTVASWFVSPVMSGAVSVLLFLICKYFILFEVCFLSFIVIMLFKQSRHGRRLWLVPSKHGFSSRWHPYESCGGSRKDIQPKLLPCGSKSRTSLDTSDALIKGDNNTFNGRFPGRPW